MSSKTNSIFKDERKELDDVIEVLDYMYFKSDEEQTKVRKYFGKRATLQCTDENKLKFIYGKYHISIGIAPGNKTSNLGAMYLHDGKDLLKWFIYDDKIRIDRDEDSFYIPIQMMNEVDIFNYEIGEDLVLNCLPKSYMKLFELSKRFIGM